MKISTHWGLLGLLAAAGCAEDKYVLDSYSTMRYEVLALPTPADSLALYSVDFVSAREGYVGGAKGSLFATTDGGQSWTRRSQPTLGTIHKLLFTTATSGWAGTSTGLYRTANGGLTWQYVPTYDGRGSAGYGVTDLQFVTPLVGYAVGTGGTINKTTNGGSTWTAQQLLLYKSYAFRAVSFTSVDSGTVVGAEQSHWRTANGGRTWEVTDYYSGRSDNLYYDVLRFNATNYLLAGPAGFQSYTSAGGAYPSEPDERYGFPVYGLATAGPNGPVVGVGQRTIIRRHAAYSQRETTPWAYVHAPDGTSFGATFFAADFADAATFYAVGPRATLYRFHYQ